MANPLLWFIQHQLWDATRKPNITQETWDGWAAYLKVNRQFAEVIAESVQEIRDRPIIVLVQDYHLYMVPRYLRDLLGERVQIQPFLHIPFPGQDAWRILPQAMREAIFDGLLASDRVGFQTENDAFNFIQCCRFYIKDAHAYGKRDSIHYKGRVVEARAYPISIDVEQVEQIAQESHTELLRRQLINYVADNRLILRIERIEPSKNILRGIEAFQILLDKYPQHRGRVNLVLLLVPSRMEVEGYQAYFQEIMGLAGIINATYSNDIWEPIRIIVGENYSRAIAAMQRYEVLLVNPVADGMNLVAKEGVIVNQRAGVLVLSEYAGAAYEMREHALIISPFDVMGTAEALHQALIMPYAERHERAEKLREIVRGSDIKYWFDKQIQDSLLALSKAESNSSTPETPSTR